MRIATKTIEAINSALEKDQGAVFRGFLEKLMPHAGDAYSTDETPFRKHLGASLIGRKCSRELWYSFRWSRKVKHNGRMIRLFNRGHLEEPRFVAMLLTIGCSVWQFDVNGKQWRISDASGHFGGSLDGVALGIPDIPEEPCLTEFKTHSDKLFSALVKEGVKLAKPEHFVQMQVYMRKMKLSYALYMAVNKNNDEIHAEIVTVETDVADRYLDRAIFIIEERAAPEKLSSNPSWFECKFCDYKPICHGKDIPAVNCRTCEYALPDLENTSLWKCNRHNISLSVEKQLAGCENYTINQQIKKPI